MVKVLFVCMGNICRSPTAQGVFERLVADNDLATIIHIDSAGTHAYHIGERPDERASAAALKRGIDLSKQKARRVSADDFQFVHIYVSWSDCFVCFLCISIAIILCFIFCLCF